MALQIDFLLLQAMTAEHKGRTDHTNPDKSRYMDACAVCTFLRRAWEITEQHNYEDRREAEAQNELLRTRRID